MEYSQKTLEKINTIWASYKGTVKTSQTKAAQAMEMNQSAFSQYLRGEIPLNTDFIAKFSTLTQTNITELIPHSDLHKISLQSICVKYTLSGRELADTYEQIPSPVNLDHAYAIVVDYSDFIFPRGTLLLVDTISKIRESDTVILQYDDKRLIYGVISYQEQEWEVLEPLCLGGKRNAIKQCSIVHRVGGTYYPHSQERLFNPQ
ncbi:hypothetical protein [Thalassotalea atypica]|uniref:hypothetical protein n=1 Tax=Thalassotalea atypica TaxID=2054316 RepID=UPI002572D181|nr:hypothetical protein [Thalassotalea atypica]